MNIRKRRSDRSGRAPLPSPGRPSVAGRDERRRFWAAIAAGMASEEAAVEAGVSQVVGTRFGNTPPTNREEKHRLDRVAPPSTPRPAKDPDTPRSSGVFFSVGIPAFLLTSGGRCGP